MAVPTPTSATSFVGNAATDTFPIAFPIQNDTDLVVTLTLDGEEDGEVQVLGTDYDIVGTGPSDTPLSSCNVVMDTPPPADSTLLVERTVPITQGVSFRTQGAFTAKSHEDALDKRTYVEQQLERRLAALEALGSLLDISEFDAILKNVDIEVDPDAVEDTFTGGAVTLTVPNGFTVTGVSVVKTAGKGGSPDAYAGGGQEAVQVRDWTQDGTTLTLGFVTGLEPGKDYTLSLLLVSTVAS